jgi:hypothetical protein
MVPRLLLGAHGGAVRGRCDEPRLDGADRRVHPGEKLLPSPRATRSTVAILMLLLGLGVAIAPGEVPGFAEPGGGMHDGGRGLGNGMQMTR